MKKRKGEKEIIIPGDRTCQTRAHNLKNGYLDLDESLWSAIQNMPVKFNK